MEQYVALINALIALVGAVTGVVVMILNARRNKNFEFVKLVEMLQKGQPLEEALGKVAVTMDDVVKKANEADLPGTISKKKWKGVMRDAFKEGLTSVGLNKLKEEAKKLER